MQYQTNQVGIIGLGVVGKTLCHNMFEKRMSFSVYDTHEPTSTDMHEKYKCVNCTSAQHLVQSCNIAFLALPTEVASSSVTQSAKGYDLKSFHDVFKMCHSNMIIYICSTLLPTTTQQFKQSYPHLNIFHVPEFLSSSSSILDSTQPTRRDMLLGVPSQTSASVEERARAFLMLYAHPLQHVAVVHSNETEATKLFCNAFYAVKVQLHNEFYSICKSHNISYNMVRHLMLQNGWIHPMHTQVPGSDGSFGFGGKCLPKDLEALVQWTGNAESSSNNNILAATLASHQNQ